MIKGLKITAEHVMAAIGHTAGETCGTHVQVHTVGVMWALCIGVDWPALRQDQAWEKCHYGNTLHTFLLKYEQGLVRNPGPRSSADSCGRFRKSTSESRRRPGTPLRMLCNGGVGGGEPGDGVRDGD